LQPRSEKSLSPDSVVRFNERLRQLGGRLEIDSHGRGTVVTTVVTVKQDSEARP
jgi:signal transduction histidine kinase